MTEPAAAPSRAAVAAAYALVLVLTVQLAVWGSFLVPLRIGATLAPVAWAVALVGNVVLGMSGGRLLGRAGAGVPALLWLVVAFTFGSRRAEGDLIVPGTPAGLIFLLLGAFGGAVAYGLHVTRTRG